MTQRHLSSQIGIGSFGSPFFSPRVPRHGSEQTSTTNEAIVKPLTCGGLLQAPCAGNACSGTAPDPDLGGLCAMCGGSSQPVAGHDERAPFATARTSSAAPPRSEHRRPFHLPGGMRWSRRGPLRSSLRCHLPVRHGAVGRQVRGGVYRPGPVRRLVEPGVERRPDRPTETAAAWTCPTATPPTGRFFTSGSAIPTGSTRPGSWTLPDRSTKAPIRSSASTSRRRISRTASPLTRLSSRSWDCNGASGPDQVWAVGSGNRIQFAADPEKCVDSAAAARPTTPRSRSSTATGRAGRRGNSCRTARCRRSSSKTETVPAWTCPTGTRRRHSLAALAVRRQR